MAPATTPPKMPSRRRSRGNAPAPETASPQPPAQLRRTQRSVHFMQHPSRRLMNRRDGAAQAVTPSLAAEVGRARPAHRAAIGVVGGRAAGPITAGRAAIRRLGIVVVVGVVAGVAGDGVPMMVPATTPPRMPRPRPQPRRGRRPGLARTGCRRRWSRSPRKQAGSSSWGLSSGDRARGRIGRGLRLTLSPSIRGRKQAVPFWRKCDAGARQAPRPRWPPGPCLHIAPRIAISSVANLDRAPVPAQAILPALSDHVATGAVVGWAHNTGRARNNRGRGRSSRGRWRRPTRRWRRRPSRR